MNKAKEASNTCKCACSGENSGPKAGGCCSTMTEGTIEGPETAPKEINGFKAQGLLEPTRYGDWDVKGRCSDF